MSENEMNELLLHIWNESGCKERFYNMTFKDFFDVYSIGWNDCKKYFEVKE